VAVPTYDRFISPLLLLLASRHEGLRSREAYAALADAVGLSGPARAELLPSGRQPVYQNRIGWANDRLKRAGLARSPSRGLWCATEAGRALVQQHPSGLPEAVVNRIAAVARDEGDDARSSVRSQPAVDTPTAPDNESPEERIHSALTELNASLAAELLELIARSSPEFFERLVLDVLVAMGYGTPHEEGVQTTPRTGDGGIDGVISLDRLGLEKVYVQAKRWQSTIGRPLLQAFYGALAGRRATKGVFITTSDFSREAREFAASVSGSIVLVDGRRLTELMIEFGVGVSTQRVVKIGRIDSDYFDEL
jgi:restriction system protein